MSFTNNAALGSGYKGNQNLMRSGYKHVYTQWEIDEYRRCRDDVVYFAKKYVKIVNVDKGLMNFELWPYQENLLRSFSNNRFVICKFPRQTGKCLHKDTYILLRNAKTGEVYDQKYPTIGAFFEDQYRIKSEEIQGQNGRTGLYPMPSMSNDGRRSDSTHHRNPQDSDKGLSAFNSFQKIFGKPINPNQRAQESGISAWRKTLSMESRFGQLQSGINQESTSQQDPYNASRLLGEKNPGRHGRGPETFVRKAVNFLTGQMHSETWNRKGYRNLVCASGKVVESIQASKLFGSVTNLVLGNNEKLQNQSSGYLFRNLGESYNGIVSEQGIPSQTLKRTDNSSGLHRFVSEENHRVRRNLLAWRKPSESYARISEGAGFISRWISNASGSRSRLQGRSESGHPNLSRLSDSVERKFIHSVPLEDYQVWTDTGWENISAIHQTIQYTEWKLKTAGHEMICADTHIVFDQNGNERFVKDLIPGRDSVMTETGLEHVLSVEETEVTSNMYDVTVESDNHRFYSNGILSHNTSCVVAWILHYIIFTKNVNAAILANKGATAREILSRLQLAYEWLPKWLQPGATIWNKGNIELGNGSKVLSAATSSDAVRGYTFNLIFFDEFAFIPSNIAEEFFNSVYPTISSGSKTRVFIVSTPNGMNKFYRMWMDAKNGETDYFPVEVNWWDVPGRDEKWKTQTIRNTSLRQWKQEFECSFLGSSNTLIEGDVLARMAWEKPIEQSADASMAIWERPKPGRTYALVVDVAHGQGLDYSTFHVIDVTTIPYVQVARYRNNMISPLVFPTLIARVGLEYNEAFVMVEINDIGAQVADILHNELAYENLMKMAPKNKGQQQVSGGYGSTQKRIQFGIKTSSSTKRLGCANLKTLIEQNKLIIRDVETIRELTTFVSTLQSFASEPGMHDDLAMALVQFAWLAAQRYFREASQSNSSVDIRTVLEREHLEMDESEQLFFGVWNNGLQEHNEGGFFLESDEDTIDDYGKNAYDRIPDKGQGVPERSEAMRNTKRANLPEGISTEDAIKHLYPDWSADAVPHRPTFLWPSTIPKEK